MRLIPQDARVLRLLLPFIDLLYKIRKTIANEERLLYTPSREQ